MPKTPPNSMNYDHANVVVQSHVIANSNPLGDGKMRPNGQEGFQMLHFTISTTALVVLLIAIVVGIAVWRRVPLLAIWRGKGREAVLRVFRNDPATGEPPLNEGVTRK